jgi:hypothetical protein
MIGEDWVSGGANTQNNHFTGFLVGDSTLVWLLEMVGIKRLKNVVLQI